MILLLNTQHNRWSNLVIRENPFLWRNSIVEA